MASPVDQPEAITSSPSLSATSHAPATSHVLPSTSHAPPATYPALPSTSALSAPHVPDHFVLIKKAGAGQNGHVFYCIPAITVIGSQELRASLRRSIVAVKTTKIGSKQDFDQAANEIYWTSELAQDARNAGLLKHFPVLLSIGLNDFAFNRHWMSMTAIEGCTLEKFMEAAEGRDGGVPAEFVLHVSVQLTEAMSFLFNHEILHGDLHFGNIMLNAFEATMGFPNIMIIDFGAAERFNSKALNKEKDWETADVWKILFSLARLVPYQCEVIAEEWVDFCKSIVEARDGETPLEEMKDQLSCFATNAIETSSDETKKTVKSLVVKAANAAGTLISDIEVMEAVHNFMNCHQGYHAL